MTNPFIQNPDLASLAKDIHADNVKAGWWTDIKTGESILQTRNRPEMLMLAVSELSEAKEGADGRMDDKLPHLPMYDVELADFVIRQLDQIGAEVFCGRQMPLFVPTAGRNFFQPKSRSDRLMYLVCLMAEAMERHRKRRTTAYLQSMADAVSDTFRIAEVEHIDLLDIIEQKRAFNRSREDHKPENRAKEGGKQF